VEVKMSTGGGGLRPWLIQRFSAIFLTGYIFFLTYFLIKNQGVQYEQWQELFSLPLMQISTLFALVCIALHAWIGLWTVLTDYVKPLSVRYSLQFIIIFALFWYVIWGVWILWGI